MVTGANTFAEPEIKQAEMVASQRQAAQVTELVGYFQRRFLGIFEFTPVRLSPEERAMLMTCGSGSGGRTFPSDRLKVIE
jgi:hypothetical protein